MAMHRAPASHHSDDTDDDIPPIRRPPATTTNATRQSSLSENTAAQNGKHDKPTHSNGYHDTESYESNAFNQGYSARPVQDKHGCMDTYSRVSHNSEKLNGGFTGKRGINGHSIEPHRQTSQELPVETRDTALNGFGVNVQPIESSMVPGAMQDQFARMEMFNSENNTAKPIHAQESRSNARPVVPSLESLWATQANRPKGVTQQQETPIVDHMMHHTNSTEANRDIPPFERHIPQTNYMTAREVHDNSYENPRNVSYDIPNTQPYGYLPSSDRTQWHSDPTPIQHNKDRASRVEHRSFSPQRDTTKKRDKEPKRLMVNSPSSARKLLNERGFSNVVERPRETPANTYANPWGMRMQSKEDRLATFRNWPKPHIVSEESLADAGWYYTGPDDRVECPSCGGAVYNWVTGDTALGEHRRHFPHCGFIQNKIQQVFEPVRNEQASPRRRGRPMVVNRQTSMDNTYKAVEEFGYSRDVIDRAVQQLSRHGEGVTSESILNVIFELEASGQVNDQLSDEPQRPQFDLTSPPEVENQGNHVLEQHNTPQVSPMTHEPQINGNTGGAFSEQGTGNLQTQFEDLQNKVTCKICLDAKIETLFLPCRHLVCCENCANLVRECPFCRAPIQGTVKVFM